MEISTVFHKNFSLGIIIALIQAVFFGSVLSNEVIYFHGLGINDEQFCCKDGRWNRDNALKPFRMLQKKMCELGYDLKMVNHDESNIVNPKYIVAFNVYPSFMKLVEKYPKEKLVALLWEPPIKTYCLNYDLSVHKYFSKIFTWDDDLVDNKTYFKIYYPQQSLEMINDLVEFEKKKFCVLINGFQKSAHQLELCSERLNVIRFFENHLEYKFDFYGPKWGSDFKNYKGIIDKKVDTLRQYKFCICYENTKANGYITEKIFDCFIAGCIPVYWGAPNVEKYIPKSCYINRMDFQSTEQLVKYLQSMNETEYNKYITNIRLFLNGDEAYFFSTSLLIETFIRGLYL